MKKSKIVSVIGLLIIILIMLIGCGVHSVKEDLTKYTTKLKKENYP